MRFHVHDQIELLNMRTIIFSCLRHMVNISSNSLKTRLSVCSSGDRVLVILAFLEDGFYEEQKRLSVFPTFSFEKKHSFKYYTTRK